LQTDQALIDLKRIRTEVEEAAALHEECMKLLYKAFSELTKLQISEEVSPFQRAHAERYRGLAIQELAVAVSSDTAAPLTGKIKEMISNTNHIMTMLLGGTALGQEITTYKRGDPNKVI
jgi:hypothetical protein